MNTSPHSLGCLLCILSSTALHATDDWDYNLPPTGLMPSYINYKTQLSSDARHGNSSFGMQQANLNIPLSDPRQTHIKDWRLALSLDMEYTHIDSNEELTLRHDNLYRFLLPISLLSFSDERNIIISVLPSLSSDFETMNRSASIGGLFAYTLKPTENFSYTLGVGYFPRGVIFGITPLVNFSWEFAPEWELNLNRTTLSLEHQVSERNRIALFAEYIGEAWTIHSEDAMHWLSISSAVVGAQWEYNFAPEGAPKQVLRARVGVPLYTTVEIQERNYDQDTQRGRTYKPSVSFSLGLDFRF